MINEISAELVGKVNKARVIGGIPSKTPEGDKTRSIAVKKAFLNSNVGVVKEDGEGAIPANQVGSGQGIATFSPKLKPLNKIIKRKPLSEIRSLKDRFTGKTDFNQMKKDEDSEEKSDYTMRKHGKKTIMPVGD